MTSKSLKKVQKNADARPRPTDHTPGKVEKSVIKIRTWNE